MSNENVIEMKGSGVVVGAGNGIGRKVALMLAVRGVNPLMIVDLSEDGVNETAMLLSKTATKCEVYTVICDVTSEVDIDTFTKEVEGKLGRVDYVVNTAGFGASNQTPVSDMDLKVFRDMMEVHCIGSFLLLRAMLQLMLKQEPCEVSCGPGASAKKHTERGSIVILTSLASEGTFLGVGNYITAKHGVKGLVQTAAIENARKGIRVNAVAPSYVSGPMIDSFLASSPAVKEAMLGDLPIGRLADPEEVADAVIFLLSGRASYINGHTLVVDGGSSLQLSNQPFKD